MKLFKDIQEKLQNEPIEKIRERCRESDDGIDQLYGLYALACLAIHIGISLLAALWPDNVLDITSTFVDFYQAIASSALILSCLIPVYAVIIYNLHKKYVYPRLRQDIKEHPETINNYTPTLAAPVNTGWVFCIMILGLFDAAAFSLSQYSENLLSISVSILIMILIPVVSFALTRKIWNQKHREQLNLKE